MKWLVALLLVFLTACHKPLPSVERYDAAVSSSIEEEDEQQEFALSGIVVRTFRTPGALQTFLQEIQNYGVCWKLKVMQDCDKYTVILECAETR